MPLHINAYQGDKGGWSWNKGQPDDFYESVQDRTYPAMVKSSSERIPLSICQDSHGSSYKIRFSVSVCYDLEGKGDEVQ